MLTNSSMGRDNYSISSALTQATGTPYQRYKTYVEDPSTLEGKTDSRTHNLRPNYSMFETLEEEMNINRDIVKGNTSETDKKPIIHYIGHRDITLYTNEKFIDPGVGVQYGTLVGTDHDVKLNPYGFPIEGEYTITYTAENSIGYAVTLTRKIRVVYAPVLKLLGDNPQNVELGSTYVEQGYEVEDLTVDVHVDATRVNPNVLGFYSVDYIGEARDGSPVRRTRYVNVVDTTPPSNVTLLGDSTVYLEKGTSYDFDTDPGVSATDLQSYTVNVTHNINSDVLGTYYITYVVLDLSSNSSIPITRTVIVRDTTPPDITIIGDTSVILYVGDTYTLPNPGASVDGSETVTFVIVEMTNQQQVQTIDTSSEQYYQVRYSATDEHGNTGTVIRSVYVRQNDTPPIITLNGNSTVYVEAYTGSYTEQGASANGGEDILISIQDPSNNTVSTIDNTVLGTYVVTYTATDIVLNQSTETRNVIVRDTTPPVLVLNGSQTVSIEYQTGTYTELGATSNGGETVSISGSVDVNTVGSYTITYSATDSNGVTGTTTRTVNVVDTVFPILTLNGYLTEYHDNSSIYTDLGATSNGGETVTAVIRNPQNVVISSIPFNATGVFTITYSATDVGGNTSSLIRTVIVQDMSAPIVTLVGEANITIELGQAFVDPGVTVNTGETPVIDGTVDTNTLGTYKITYTVIDSALNRGFNCRFVNVVDNTPPVITISGNATFVVLVGGTYTDAGATSDGGETVTSVITDSSGNVVSSIDTSSEQTFEITYSATDVNGNESSVVRTVIVTNTPNPIVIINGGATITMERGDVYTELGAVSSGGETIVITTNLNVNIAATYTVTYTATNGGGFSGSASRTVIVSDTVAPTLTLNGAHPMTLEAYTQNYVEPGITANEPVTTTTTYIKSNNTVISSIPNDVIDTYTVRYVSVDPSGNQTIISRSVVYQDTTGPVITLNGSNPQVVERYSTYVESGASAADGPNSVAVTIDSSSLDTSIVGTQAVAYSASDSYGNSTTVNRTIIVEDTTPPVITLNGTNPHIIERLSTYTDPGATASDNGVSFSVTSSGSVNTSVAADYTRTYTSTDDENNTSSITRIVRVQDTTPPNVTITGNYTVYIEWTTGTYTEQGATTNDDEATTAQIVTTYRTGSFTGTVVSSISNATQQTYYVTYSLTDPHGNTGYAYREVVVRDTTPPTLTLNGNNPYYVERLTGTFNDPGTTANETTTVVATIRDSSNVVRASIDNSVNGDWTVTYVHTDTSGNVNSIVRNVTVRDTTGPIVSITGNNPYHVEYTTGTWTDQGSGANEPSTLTSTVIRNPSGVVSTSVDNTVFGNWTVTYTRVDPYGNSGTGVRTVNVADTTIPTVTIQGNNPYYVERLTGSWTDQGSTADEPTTVVVTIRNPSNTVQSSINNTVVGNWTVTYTHTDASNNSVDAVRTVTVRDTTNPVVSITGSNPYYVERSSGSWTDQGSSANETTTLTSTVIRDPSNTVQSSINNAVVGNWTVTYTRTDPYGNSGSANRTVTVRDTTNPTVSLSGSNPYYVEYTTGSWTDQGSSANETTTLTSTVIRNPSNTVKSSINNSVLGNWTVTYTRTDSYGNSGTASRTVIVRDTVAPVITLTGSNPETVARMDTFSDPGATATDAGGSVTVSEGGYTLTQNGGYGNPYAVGATLTYLNSDYHQSVWTRSYSANDGRGNISTTTRTINVVDWSPPNVLETPGNSQVTAGWNSTQVNAVIYNSTVGSPGSGNWVLNESGWIALGGFNQSPSYSWTGGLVGPPYRYYIVRNYTVGDVYGNSRQASWGVSIAPASSDPRLKDNIKPLCSHHISTVYTWTWNETATRLYGLNGDDIGFVSSEVPQEDILTDAHGYDYIASLTPTWHALSMIRHSNPDWQG